MRKDKKNTQAKRLENTKRLKAFLKRANIDIVGIADMSKLKDLPLGQKTNGANLMVLYVPCCAAGHMIRDEPGFLQLSRGRGLQDFCRRGMEQDLHRSG